jgi:hypothetical protein
MRNIINYFRTNKKTCRNTNVDTKIFISANELFDCTYDSDAQNFLLEIGENTYSISVTDYSNVHNIELYQRNAINVSMTFYVTRDLSHTTNSHSDDTHQHCYFGINVTLLDENDNTKYVNNVEIHINNSLYFSVNDSLCCPVEKNSWKLIKKLYQYIATGNIHKLKKFICNNSPDEQLI